MSECLHCSNHFAPSKSEGEFCCAGCRYTYSLINEQGLDQFYQLKGSKLVEPVGDRAFAAFDPTWISEASANRKPGEAFQCHIEGLSCVGCVWLIEKIFADHVPGGRIELRIADASARLRAGDSNEELIKFAKQAQKFGYTIQSPSSQQKQKSESSRLLARLGVTAGLAMNCMGFSLPRYLGMPRDFEFARLFDQIAWISATLALMVGGSWFIKRAYRALKLKQLHIDLPIAIGLLAAYAGSIYGWINGQEALIYFDFVAIFSTLMLAGRYLQTHVLERNRNKLRADSPEPSPVRRPNTLETIEPSMLQVGDTFELEPGQVLPVNATLLSPVAEASLEWIDGEPEPRLFKSGDHLPSGSRPLTAKAEFQAEQIYQNSVLAGLLNARSPDQRSPTSDRLLATYLVIILALAGAGFCWHFYNSGSIAGLQVAISILVISCPCALGIALPLATEMANHQIRKQGVHITGQAFWSRISRVKQWVMDKTGTLTNDLPKLKESSWLDKAPRKQIEILAALTRHSSHPFSRSLYQRCTERLGKAPEIELSDWTEIPASGPQATAPDNSTWSLRAPQNEAIGAACELYQDDTKIHHFAFHEALRNGAAETISWARSIGLQPQILSGDKQSAVAAICKQLDLPDSQGIGNQSPEQKAQWLQSNASPSLFLGDGINDALAIEAASVAGCPATGQGWTKAKVDFYYTTHDLNFISHLFEVAKCHRSACTATIIFAILYNSIAIGVCFTGAMTPLLAAVLMPLSSLISIAIVANFFRKMTRKFTSHFEIVRRESAHIIDSDGCVQYQPLKTRGSRV